MQKVGCWLLFVLNSFKLNNGIYAVYHLASNFDITLHINNKSVQIVFGATVYTVCIIPLCANVSAFNRL